MTSFLLYKVEKMSEFSQSLYITLTSHAAIFIIVAFPRKIMKLIGEFEIIIEKRKVLNFLIT